MAAPTESHVVRAEESYGTSIDLLKGLSIWMGSSQDGSLDMNRCCKWCSVEVQSLWLRMIMGPGCLVTEVTNPARALPHNSINDASKSICYYRFRLDKNERRWLTETSSDRSSCSVDDSAAQHYIYTSATQRSFEEVNWSKRFPGYVSTAEATMGNLADPVSDRPSFRRYYSRPQLWQSVGNEWNRRQFRSRNDARKPISFCSIYARSGQIPSYTGTIGSENLDNIDNMEADFQPLTVKRSITPSYTLTAHRTTIPGYAGRGVYAHHAVNETPISGVTRRSERAAPLSKMVTPVTPCNPYLSTRLPAFRANGWRDVSPVKMKTP